MVYKIENGKKMKIKNHISMLILLIFLLMFVPSVKAAKEVFYNESLNEQTTDSTSYIEALVLNFRPYEQDDFLVIASGEMRQSGGTLQEVYAQLTIDGIEYDGAIFRPPDVNNWIPFSFMVNVSINSTQSHSIKINFKSSATDKDAQVRNLHILAWSVDLEAYNESTGESIIANSVMNKTNLTFIPSSTGDYLVIATAEYKGPQTNPTIVRLLHNGTDIGNTSMYSDAGLYSYYSFGMFKKLTLNASRQIFNIELEDGGGTTNAYIRNARIAVIKLEQWEYYYNESEGETSTSSTSYVDKLVNNYTTSEAVDYLIIGTVAAKYSTGSSSSLWLIDSDNNITGNSSLRPRNVNDYPSLLSMRVLNLSQAGHMDRIRFAVEDSSKTANAKSARLISIAITPANGTFVKPIASQEFMSNYTVEIVFNETVRKSRVTNVTFLINGTVYQATNNTAIDMWEYNYTIPHNLMKGNQVITVQMRDSNNTILGTTYRTIIITPRLDSVSASPSPVKGGGTVYISPRGVNDSESTSLYYFCSEASTTPNSSTNICSGNNVTTYSSPYSTMNCSFTTATDDTTHTIHCRVYDGTYYSGVKNTTYTTDSTVPSTSIVSVAGDTSSPYYDTVNDGWTNITVSGESGMSCRWEDQDHGYSSIPSDSAHTCSVSGTQATCSPQNLVQSLTTNLYVSCMDSVGNEQNSTNNLDVSIVIDWTAPTTTDNSSTTIVVPPYAVNITESDNLYGTPSIATKYCTDTVGTCTPNIEIGHGGTVTFTSSNRGQNFFRYNSSDPAGNVQTIQNKTININQLPVFTSATSNTITIKGGENVTISTVSSDADSGQTLKLYVCNSTSTTSSGCSDGTYCSNISASANASCQLTSESDDTTHTWYAFIYDSLNEAAVANYRSGTYTTDSTSPTITIIDPDNTTYTYTSVPAAVSLGESGSWVGYCIDSCASNATMTNSTLTYWVATMSGLSDTTSHTVVFYANDSYGNMGTNNVTFYVDTSATDTIAPTIIVWSPINGTYYTSTSILANITLSENGSWAGYSLNGTANQTMGNVSTTSWNSTMTLPEGEHNITFFANDTSTNANMGNSSVIYFTVDNSTPQNTTQGPLSADDTVNIVCYSRWTDNIALSHGYLEQNSTGTSTNSSQVSLSGTSGWVNVTINASDTNPGIIQCKAYVFDKAGLVNTSTWFVNITDATNPIVENITYNPNTTEDLDPNIVVNITTNVSDNGQLSSVNLQYKLTNESTWNTYTMSSVTGNVYIGNFTPTEGNWSFRINATDSYGNENVSDMTNISVALDRTWVNTTTIPSIKSIVRTQSRVFSLGNLTVNNTGDYDFNFTVTSNRDWITFNGTNTSLEFILNRTGNVTTFNTTVNTTGFAVGTYTFSITINSYTLNPSLVSTSTIPGTVVIQNVAGPYFDVKIVTYDSSVTQGDSGINLQSSVENAGTEDATSTWLAWTLPSEWSITSGTANVSVGFLGIGEKVFNSITMDVGSSADTGAQTITASAGCYEGVTGSETKTVSVSALTTTTTTTTTAPASLGGAGGGGAAGALIPTKKEKELLLQTGETLEIVRGLNDTFPIRVKNPFKGSTLENTTLDVTGYLAQYLKIMPDMISNIQYNETKTFNIIITAPTYMKKGTHTLNFTISGKVVYPTVIQQMTEYRLVTLVVHEVSKQEANITLAQATKDLNDMLKAGFSATKAQALLDQAIAAFGEKDYEKTKELAEQVINIKETAFATYDLIQDVRAKINASEADGIDVPQTKKHLNLALAAFEREDYDTAKSRIKEAQFIYVIETISKINIIKLLKDYWWAVLTTIVVGSIGGLILYRRLTVILIAKKLKDLEVEERSIEGMIKEAQVKTFEKKTMPMIEYYKTMYDYERRLAEIKKTRVRLMVKKIGIITISKELDDLKKADEKIFNLIQETQKDLYERRVIDEATYAKRMEEYESERARIQDRLAFLEVKKIKEAKVRFGFWLKLKLKLRIITKPIKKLVAWVDRTYIGRKIFKTLKKGIKKTFTVIQTGWHKIKPKIKKPKKEIPEIEPEEKKEEEKTPEERIEIPEKVLIEEKPQERGINFVESVKKLILKFKEKIRELREKLERSLRRKPKHHYKPQKQIKENIVYRTKE